MEGDTECRVTLFRRRLYFLIFGSLLALTALTTGMAYVDLGQWNTIVALVIACCKATLVVLFFMHLRWSPRLMRVVLLSALLWLAILISLTTTDFFSRDWTPIPEGWRILSAAPTWPAREFVPQTLTPFLPLVGPMLSACTDRGSESLSPPAFLATPPQKGASQYIMT